MVLVLAFAAAGAAAGRDTPVRPGEAEVALVYGLSALHEAAAHRDSGRTAAADERLEAAVAELRAAVGLAPGDGNARLLLGLAELLRGDAAGAEASFDAGRRAARSPDPGLRTAVEGAAGRIAAHGPATASVAELEGILAIFSEVAFRRLAADRPPRWAAQIGVSIAHDSNPGLLAEDFFVETPAGDLASGSDADAVGTLLPRFELHPVFDRGGWSLGLAVEGSYSRHGDLDYLDLGAGTATVTAGRGRSPLGFLAGPLGSVRVPVGEDRVAFALQGGGGYYWVDGSSYLRRLAAAASVTLYHPRSTSATQVDLVARERTFFGGDLGDSRRSGRSVGLQVSQTFFFRAADRYLRAAVLAETASAERPFEASSLQPSLETHLPLGRRWSLHLAATLRRDDYDHPESDLFHVDPSTPPRPRKDETWRLTALLSRRLTDEVRLALRLTRSRRDSDVSGPGGLSLDYERWVMAMRLSCFLGGRE